MKLGVMRLSHGNLMPVIGSSLVEGDFLLKLVL